MFGVFKKKTPQVRKEPVINITVASGERDHFFSGDSDSVLSGWETSSNGIDFHLRNELRKVQARARKIAHKNPWGSRYCDLLKNNVVGSSGFKLDALCKFNNTEKLDEKANAAVEAAWEDFSKAINVDAEGKRSLAQLLSSGIVSVAHDGGLMFEVVEDNRSKYGIQLRAIDLNTINYEKNEQLGNGREIRLGVEYDKNQRVVRYWFKERSFFGDYSSGKEYSIRAENIIYCFDAVAPNQSHGIPLMAPGLETAKHLEKYSESAIVNARSTANTIAAITSKGSESYQGDEQDDESGQTYDLSNPLEMVDIGNRSLESITSKYPTDMYGAFVSTHWKQLCSAWSVSYTSLISDLSDTSYSSGRTGVQEEREMYKFRQKMIIEQVLDRLFERWILKAYMKGLITVNGKALANPISYYEKFRFHGRRWDWVDPKSDAAANCSDIKLGLKSRKEVIEARGGNYEDTVKQIQAEEVVFGSASQGSEK